LLTNVQTPKLLKLLNLATGMDYIQIIKLRHLSF
jgi:hypothetical protein